MNWQVIRRWGFIVSLVMLLEMAEEPTSGIQASVVRGALVALAAGCAIPYTEADQ